MEAPQIIAICFMGVGLLLTAFLHGKPRTDKFNVFSTLVSDALWIGLLLWGGFFNGR
jgi:hypothetical protein